jgi:hypothetical protein
MISAQKLINTLFLDSFKILYIRYIFYNDWLLCIIWFWLGALWWISGWLDNGIPEPKGFLGLAFPNGFLDRFCTGLRWFANGFLEILVKFTFYLECLLPSSGMDF